MAILVDSYRFMKVMACFLLPTFWSQVLEKSEFRDESQYFRFHADEEMEGTNSKSKPLRNDFKLIENILAKSLLVRKINPDKCVQF